MEIDHGNSSAVHEGIYSAFVKVGDLWRCGSACKEYEAH